MTDGHTRSPAELLMELGRDREAVAVARRQPRADDQGGAMDGAQQLDRIIPALKALVANLGEADVDRPTPCANFTVAGVLEHMIGGAGMFAPAFRGEAGGPGRRSDEGAGGGPGGGSVQARFAQAMDDLLDAVHSPGAQERTFASPFGEVPGAMFARYVAFDGLVHGWDLATSTGQAYDPPAQVVAEVDQFIRGLLQPPMRDGDTFGAEADPPADASPLERVVAFSGRTVPR